MDRKEEAFSVGAKFLKNVPDYSFEEFVKSWHFKDDAYQDKIAEDLRKAGLSEKRL